MTERVEDMPKHEPHGSGMNGNGVGIHIDDAEIRQWIQDPDLIRKFRQIAAEKYEQEAGRRPIPKMGSRQILTSQWPDPVYVVQDILPIGLASIGGLPKLGKSWMSLQLVRSVATGSKLFNRRCKKGKVWYLALEDSYPRLFHRMRKQGWEAQDWDVEFTTMDGLKAIGDMRHGGTERILEEIDKNDYFVTIIDTLSRIIKGDQKERHEVDPILEPLQIGAQQMGRSIVLIDHHRKSVGATGDITGDSLMDNAGTVAKSGTVDTAWNLYRKRGETMSKLSIIGRDVADEMIIQLNFNKDNCTWEYQGDVQEAQNKSNRQIVCDTLAELGQATLSGIAKQTGIAASTLQNVLDGLLRDGFVERDRYTYTLRKGV